MTTTFVVSKEHATLIGDPLIDFSEFILEEDAKSQVMDIILDVARVSGCRTELLHLGAYQTVLMVYPTGDEPFVVRMKKRESL